METEKTFKSGYVAVAGRPNVGKSTLVNTLLGQKIAAVTPRPQTTRKQQLGILTLEHAQIVFIDTPGIHQAHHKLGERMNEQAIEAISDVDLILVLVDASQAPLEDDALLADVIRQSLSRADDPPPVIVAVNKIDLVSPEDLPTQLTVFGALFPEAELFPISAIHSGTLADLVQTLVAALPDGEPFFSPDQVTDLYEREIAADLIRASALIHLRDEVPHAIAVRVDDFTERGDSGAYIAATLFVERESQKGIVIGRGGIMLKKIGSEARREIEAMSGRSVFLDLRVKVRPNWRNDEEILKRFGFTESTSK